MSGLPFPILPSLLCSPPLRAVLVYASFLSTYRSSAPHMLSSACQVNFDAVRNLNKNVGVILHLPAPHDPTPVPSKTLAYMFWLNSLLTPARLVTRRSAQGQVSSEAAAERDRLSRAAESGALDGLSPDDRAWIYFSTLAPASSSAGGVEEVGAQVFARLALSRHPLLPGSAAGMAAASFLPDLQAEHIYNEAYRLGLELLAQPPEGGRAFQAAIFVSTCTALTHIVAFKHRLLVSQEFDAAFVRAVTRPTMFPKWLREFPDEPRVQLVASELLCGFVSRHRDYTIGSASECASAALASAFVLAARIVSVGSVSGSDIPSHGSGGSGLELVLLRGAFSAQASMVSQIGCTVSAMNEVTAQPGAADAAVKLLRFLLDNPPPQHPGDDTTAGSRELRAGAFFLHLACATTDPAIGEENRRTVIRGGGPRLLVRALEALAGRDDPAGLCAQHTVAAALAGLCQGAPLLNNHLALKQLAAAGGAVAALSRLVRSPPTGVCGADGSDAVPPQPPSDWSDGAPHALTRGDVDKIVIIFLGGLFSRVGNEAVGQISPAAAEALLCAACRFLSLDGYDDCGAPAASALLLVSLIKAEGPHVSHRAAKAVELGAAESAYKARLIFAPRKPFFALAHRVAMHVGGHSMRKSHHQQAHWLSGRGSTNPL